MTTTTPPELAAAGLEARAVHTARAYRAADPHGFHRRHDDPDQWNRWARRARVARTIAAALHVPLDAVLVTDDPHRTYHTRTGPVPGDLITVTDPATGRAWRFIPDVTTPGDGWLLLGRCPDRDTEIPVTRIACLVDLGEHLDPGDDTGTEPGPGQAPAHRHSERLAMTAVITPRDEAAAVTTNGYRYDRVVEIAGHIVRARIERTFSVHHSLAHVEMINDQKSWTHLAQDAARNWWDTTPPPRNHVDPATVLGPVADQLLRRAAAILTPAPTPPPRTLSPDVLDAVSALLATAYGYDGERRIDPDQIEWATTRAGALQIIVHADGSVTFTKAHRDECPFITSSGTQDCDDDCYFQHPADAHRRLGQ